MCTSLVLGAGFSKAIADLPVTTEMFDRFKSVMKEQDHLGHSNRVNWGKIIFEFVNNLEEEYLIRPYERATKDGTILSSNYIENFEGLCSFIDLNLAFEVNARSESNGIKADLSGKPLFVNYTTPELKALRGYIGTYLYLSLIGGYIKEYYLDLLNARILNEVSSVISFNYDIVLEKYLYSKNRWYPKDGYGFQLENLPKIKPDFKNAKSDFEILKLHGSLNWEVESIYHPNFELKWFDDNNEYFFPGYLCEEKGYPFIYQGGLSSVGWLLPSWIKQFEYKELIQVWKKASLALRNADQIYFIGYSLPRADSAVYALLSGIDFSNKKVSIIDPNADQLRENYSKIIHSKNIEFVQSTLEDYLIK